MLSKETSLNPIIDHRFWLRLFAIQLTKHEQHVDALKFLDKLVRTVRTLPATEPNFPFEHSEAGLLLGGAILGFCPDFEVEPFNLIVFPL